MSEVALTQNIDSKTVFSWKLKEFIVFRQKTPSTKM
ncbi:hypothetical protein BF28_5470 (plasmid) [Bacillus cereus E33L]|nr:hypothetical protein BF28_5470 [Bacillus cereus E33L]